MGRGTEDERRKKEAVGDYKKHNFNIEVRINAFSLRVRKKNIRDAGLDV